MAFWVSRLLMLGLVVAATVFVVFLVKELEIPQHYVFIGMALIYNWVIQSKIDGLREEVDELKKTLSLG